MRPVKVQVVDDPVSEVEQAAGVVTEGDDVTVEPVSAEPRSHQAPPTSGGRGGQGGGCRGDRRRRARAPGGDGVRRADDGEFPLAFLAVTVKV